MAKEEKKDEKKEVKKKKGGSLLTQDISFSNKVPVLDVVLSIRHLSIMIKSSMSLSEALVVLSEQTENPKLQDIYAKVNLDVQAGMPMAESMRKHPKAFSHIMVSIIEVGERGGTLETNLLFLADFLKKDYELNRKVKGALVYPVIVFGITVVEMLGVVFFLLPKLDSLFSAFDDIPAFTQFILNVTGWVRTRWYIVVALLGVLFAAFKVFMGTPTGKRVGDTLTLKFPVMKDLKKKQILANFSRTIAILLESSIPISESIQISANTVDNYVYQQAVLEIHKKVSSGVNLADAMSNYDHLFPATFIKMIQIGEETGTLEENLLYLHEFYAEEVTEMSNNLASLIEPILLVFIGLMIGLLAFTIVGPIYQLTGSINAN
jgi:type IV pilus assembly protein PilC